MRDGEKSPLGLTAMGIAALFLAGFFLLVVLGARGYLNTVAGQNENMRSRALLSYLSTCVKSGDSRGAVSVAESEFGPVLTVADGNSGYGLKIYRIDGVLVEEYAHLQAALQPTEAQTIAPTERFEPSLAGDVLTVETDAGRVLLHLRSEGGGEK